MRRATLLLLTALAAGAAAASVAGDPAAEMAAAAREFLSSLPADKQKSVTWPLADAERENWHFVPRRREGVPLKGMTAAQRERAQRLLGSALSTEGTHKAAHVLALDQVLFDETGNPIRDPDLYFFTVFGAPAPRGDWGWRFEGHHLSLNFTLHDGRVVSTTPAFFGANPAEVRRGPHQGLRTLAAEEDLGRRLLSLLTPEQRTRATIAAEAPADIVTGASRRAQLGAPEGLPFSAMNAEQRAALLELLDVYARRLRPELAAAEMERIRGAGLEKIYFAWAGGARPGQGHYYRLHGPTFVIEYDNTQDNANHIHTVWRDFERDFGRDLLREHYARSPHHAQKDETRKAKLEIQ